MPEQIELLRKAFEAGRQYQVKQGLFEFINEEEYRENFFNDFLASQKLDMSVDVEKVIAETIQRYQFQRTAGDLNSEIYAKVEEALYAVKNKISILRTHAQTHERKHSPDCRWETSNCAYKDTHHYCPHPEHACDCKGESK